MGEFAAVLIITAVILGLVPAFIADSKGRSFIGWWVYGVFLFLIAVIHVIVIEKKVDPSTVKKCPFCAEQIKAEAIVCKHCGKELESNGNKAESPSQNEPNNNREDGIAFTIFMVIFVVVIVLSMTFLT